MEKVFVLSSLLQLPTRWSFSISTSVPFNYRQVAYKVAKNDAHLALSPTFRYVFNESPLLTCSLVQRNELETLRVPIRFSHLPSQTVLRTRQELQTVKEGS
ncbi:hypothetical protein TNCV_3281171 [Trichonephila clavipes]|nr:hypothetical protein TNCV_3281171 [Trichonephila clavipes]